MDVHDGSTGLALDTCRLAETAARADHMTSDADMPTVHVPLPGDRDPRGERGHGPLPTLTIVCAPGPVVRLVGELDIATAAQLAAVLDGLALPGGRLQIDVAELTFIDSSGIQVLCVAADRLGPRGRLVVTHPQRAVRRALELTGLEGLLDVGVDRSTPPA